MTFVLDHVSSTAGLQPVITDVSVALAPGTISVLLGPTLAGKTSLMRLMAGLDQPASGRIFSKGRDVTGIPVRRRSVAMVYQQFVNYPTMTVYENIASPLRVAGISRSEIESRVREAARVLHLDSLLQRMPAQLSGGQQQRTAIARALVKRAELVLLDEPLANLDYKLREELREELPRIFAATGAILVYATTEPVEALLLGGDTLTLHEGRVTQAGPTASVYRRPGNIEAARVFSDPPLNELKVEKRNGVLRLADGRQVPATGALQHLGDGAWHLAFRAEAATVTAGAHTGFSFPGKVLVTEINGSESFVHVDTGDHVWVSLAGGVQDFPPGQMVRIEVDTAQIFAFDAGGRLAVQPTPAEMV